MITEDEDEPPQNRINRHLADVQQARRTDGLPPLATEAEYRRYVLNNPGELPPDPRVFFGDDFRWDTFLNQTTAAFIDMCA